MYRPATFAERLKTALDYKQMTKAELSRMTGISKSSLTRYAKGDWEGKQDAVYAIAQALNLNEAWLMGYDVPMDRTELDRVLEQAKILNEESQSFLENHLGLIYGNSGATHIGVSIHPQSMDEREILADILLGIAMLSNSQQIEKLDTIKGIVEVFKRLPVSRCKEILNYVNFIAQQNK